MLADPNAVVDDAAQVFGKVSVNVRTDRADLFAEKHLDVRVSGARGLRESARTRSYEPGAYGRHPA